jgi:hypothetical protein
MAIERFWEKIGPVPLTADGTENGKITVEDTDCFKVKAFVLLKSDTQGVQRFQIKRVISKTEMFLGLEGTKITARSDLSIFKASENTTIEQPEQEKVKLDQEDMDQATYEQEPTVARRSLLVDKGGNHYTVMNPFPVRLSDGNVNIGTVNAELEVQLSHKDNSPDPGDVRDTVNVVDGFLIRRFEKIDNVEYEGLADQGSLTNQAKWRITRKVKQPNGDLVTSIVGDTTYDQIWDNRQFLFPAVTPTDFFDRKWEKILPLLNNANFLKLGNFDSVIPSFAGDIATLNYFESGANIARIKVRYIHELDWDMTLEAFINNTNGDILLDDDGTSLILE